MHETTMGLIVERSGAVHRAPVVPEHEIARPPLMCVNELGPSCMGLELNETSATFLLRHPDDLSNLRLTKEKCLPTSLGMSSDHGVFNRENFRLLLRSHGRKVAVSSRIEI